MKPVFYAAMMSIMTPLAAAAADVCMPVTEMEAGLVDWYGETPVETDEEESARIWASKQTGTWTLVKYLVDGNACVIAQGENWMPQRNEMLLSQLSE